MILACAFGTPLVSAKWLLDSAQAGSVLPLEGYRIEIAPPEPRCYANALMRARAEKREAETREVAATAAQVRVRVRARVRARARVRVRVRVKG